MTSSSTDINSKSTDTKPEGNTWIELSEASLRKNVTVFRDLLGKDRIFAAIVKADAYGHGMIPVATVAIDAGVDLLGVFSVDEGVRLRESGIDAPVLVLGPTRISQIEQAADCKLKLTVASFSFAKALASHPAGSKITVHIKLETGTNRQGLLESELCEACDVLADAKIIVEGAYSHFADIEDTTEHKFAEGQLRSFESLVSKLRGCGHELPILHTACTAAAILFPNTYFSMARVGIGLYGLWPSKETRVSAGALGRDQLKLSPVLTWKTEIAQVKHALAGSYVGYGRTFRTTRATKLAILPIGYSDGYDRALSNSAHVLIRGMRAPVIGRVCMNFTMVDVTDISGVEPGDEVVLLGTQGEESITADDLARLAGTINYEIVTRIAPRAPRILV